MAWSSFRAVCATHAARRRFRADYTDPMNLRERAERHPLAALVVSLFLASAALSFRFDGTAGQIAPTAIAAVVSLACLAYISPALIMRRKDRGSHRISRPVLHSVQVSVRNIVFFVLASGFTGLLVSAALMVIDGNLANLPPLAGDDVSSMAADSSGQSAFLLQDMLPRAAFLLAWCAATGLFEELLFRGITVLCLAQAFEGSDAGKADSMRRAAFASAIIFALLHISTGDTALAHGLSAGVVAAALLKGCQAFLFGFSMAALLVARRSVWVPVLVHICFDVVYFAVPVLLAGALPDAYLSESVGNIVLLTLTTALLVPPFAYALRFFRAREISGEHGE